MRSLVLLGLASLVLSTSCGRTDRIEGLEEVPSFELLSATLADAEVGEAYAAGIALIAAPAPGRVDWSVVGGSLPPGLALLPQGVLGARISGTPTTGGLYTFTVRAVDDLGRVASNGYTIRVGAADPLEIVTLGLPPGVVGEGYEALVTARGGNPPYAWRISGGRIPDGLTFGDAPGDEGQLIGVPEAPGDYVFDVEVQDARGAFASRTYSMQILGGPDLRIVTASLPQGRVGEPYFAEIEAAGGRPPYAWMAVVLPRGLFVDPAGTPSTFLQGTPEEAGRFEVQIAALDGNQIAPRVFELEILSDAPQLRILTNTLPSGRVSEAYDAPIAADGGVPPYTWRVRDGSAPSGLFLQSNGTPSTSLRGTPQRIQTSRFEVEVSDAVGATARRPFTVQIEAAIPPLRILTTALPDGLQGSLYEVEVEADGGVPPYEWAVVNGNLPGGLALGPAGTPSTRIAGQITTQGNFTFEVLVTDASARTARRTYTISVAQAPTPPIITTISLPAARRCEGYSAPIAVTGGLSPLTWRVSAGTLPTGLALGATGTPGTTLTGYPDAVGTASFTVQVTDALGQIDSRAFTVTVADAPDVQRWVGLIGRIDNNARDLYLSNVCGASPTPAVRAATGNGSLFGNNAAFSPDGRKIAFLGDYRQSSVEDLWLVDLSGPVRGAPVLVHAPGTFGREVREFAFSPDGNWLAFVGDLAVDGRLDVMVVDVSNPSMPGPTRIVSTVGPVSLVNGSIVELLWSPDSTHIAYRGSLEQLGRQDVYLTTVTSSVGHVRLNPTPGFDADVFDLVWSPTGNGLAYAGDFEANGKTDLYWVAVNPSSGAVSAPVLVSDLPATGDVRSGRFAVSPDGRWLAYTAAATTQADELFAVSLGGGVPGPQTRLHAAYPSTRDVIGLEWSPTAPRLVYVADQDQENVTELFLVDLTGATPSSPVKLNLPLPATSDVRTGPTNLAWSHDGGWVAFLVAEFNSGPQEIYTTDLRGAVPVTRPVGPPRVDPALDARGLFFAPRTNHLAVVGDLLQAGVSELFFVNLTGSAPSAPARVNPPLTANGDVRFTSGGVAFRADGSGIFYIADQVTDFVDEAWVVSVLGGTPGPSTRLHATLGSNRRVESILVP